MSESDFKILLETYVALTLARHAAERAAAPVEAEPYLQTVLSNQLLALEKLEGLISSSLTERRLEDDLECLEITM